MDSDVLIQAANVTYRSNEFPGIWVWIRLLAEIGKLASVEAVRGELQDPDVAAEANKLPSDTFRTEDAAVNNALTRVTQWVDSQPRFTESAKHEFLDVADCHLVAEALAYGGIVVTHEKSEPDSKKSVKIPDVCHAFGIECILPHEMLAREGARFVLDDAVRQELQTRISQSNTRRN